MDLLSKFALTRSLPACTDDRNSLAAPAASDKPEDKPVAVLFLPIGQTDRPAPSLFEIDCVVPFYVP